MKTLFIYTFLIFMFFTTGCSHSISIKGSRFFAPVTANEQWGGFATLSAGGDTRVTLVNDITANPPTRSSVLINQDVDAGDIFGINYLGIEAGLSVVKSLEVYLDNSLLGLRWQFLNHGAEEGWVAAIEAGYASSSQGRSFDVESGNSSSATSKVARAQGGLSLGYKVNEHFLPYLSYIYESYDVKTDVTNSYGSFGPYTDKGHHNLVSFGIMRPGPGIILALEYTHIFINWTGAPKSANQDAIGARFGFGW
ncbi:MAG: hypothetical protein H6623_05495 [Bdellovibrionaceae bacterium]|nr:hypothetical protein [Pseudobdellovibrionaceae bacterium]